MSGIRMQEHSRIADSRVSRSCVWLPVAFVIVAALAAAACVGFYVFEFHHAGLSDDGQDWSDFGNYVGGTVGPLVGLMTLAVILYIAVIVGNSQKAQECLLNEQAHKTSLAFDMHREFHAKSMLMARSEAVKFAYKDSCQTPDKLDIATDPAAPKLLAVIHFYQRLSLAVKHDQINKGVVPDLFGEAFVWWCQRCFKSRLQPTGWESWQRIDELMKWLIENVKSEDLKSWKSERKNTALGWAPPVKEW